MHVYWKDFGISTCRKKPASHCSAQCTLRRQVYAEKYCSGRADDVRVLLAPFAFSSLSLESAAAWAQCTPQVMTHTWESASPITATPPEMHNTHKTRVDPTKNMGCAQGRRVNWSRWFFEWKPFAFSPGREIQRQRPLFLFAEWFFPLRVTHVKCLMDSWRPAQHAPMCPAQSTSCSWDYFWITFLWVKEWLNSQENELTFCLRASWQVKIPHSICLVLASHELPDVHGNMCSWCMAFVEGKPASMNETMSKCAPCISQCRSLWRKLSISCHLSYFDGKQHAPGLFWMLYHTNMLRKTYKIYAGPNISWLMPSAGFI